MRLLSVVRSSLGERNDVVDFLDRHVASFLQALLTQRMLVDVPITDSFQALPYPSCRGE